MSTPGYISEPSASNSIQLAENQIATAKQQKSRGQDENARNNLKAAERILRDCKEDRAFTLLKEVETELSNLG